jgi:hypothetical protein
MISLREQVANIKAKNPDYETQTILAYYDMIQEFVYSRDLDQMLFFDTTGFPPFLQTLAGHLQYSFPDGTYAARVRKTSAILFSTQDVSSGWGYGSSQELYDIYNLRGREYYIFPLTQNESNEQEDNVISFQNDPGETTEHFYHLFFKKPPKITTIESPCIIPSSHSLRLQACVLELIANEDFGDRESLDYIERTLVRKIWADMDKAKQGRPMRTPLRMQDRWTGNTR